MFAGITNFNGYWGCERCRTRGENVETKSDAKTAKDLSKKHGSYPHQRQGNDDDDEDAGQEENGVVAAAGKKPPKAAAKAAGPRGVVKFPELTAKARKDTDWKEYRKREKEEEIPVSTTFIHYKQLCNFFSFNFQIRSRDSLLFQLNEIILFFSILYMQFTVPTNIFQAPHI